jgi:hypothetical protein
VRWRRFIVGGTLGPSASVTGVATVTLATGRIIKLGAADVTGVATVSADANRILGTTASVTGVATVTLATGTTSGLGSASVTGIATVSAVAYVLYSADASVTGVATVTAEADIDFFIKGSCLPNYNFFQPNVETKVGFFPAVTTVVSLGF